MNNDIKHQIPFKGDNFEFIEMINHPSKDLHIPLTDMECALIDNVFLYSHLIHDKSFEYNGQRYNVTDEGRAHFKQIFDLLTSIVSQDERAIEKMDEFRYLQSFTKDIILSHSAVGGESLS